MRVWSKGAMRTSYTLLGPFGTLVRKLPGINESYGLSILKCLHWFGGFLILVCIYLVVSKYFIPKSSKNIFVVLFPWLVLIMPATVTSLKIFNYDLYAMVFAVLSFVLILAAIKEKSKLLAYFAVLFAYLGAQEKLNAAPFLLVTIVILGWLSWQKKKRVVDLLVGITTGFLFSLMVGIVCFAIVFIVRHGNVSNEYWHGIAEPLGLWVYPILMSVIPMELPGPFFSPGLFNSLILPLISLSLCFISSIFLCYLDYVVLARFSKHRVRFSQFSSRTILILFLVILCLGIFGTYFVQAYWAPYSPLLQGEFHAFSSMNNVTYHFRAFSNIQHLFYSLSYSCSIFINAIPTVYWFILGLWFYLLSIQDYIEKFTMEILVIDSMLLLAMAFPIVFGLFQLPPGNKYFNIGLLFLSIGVLIIIIHAYLSLPIKINQIYKYAMNFIPLLILAELLPFGPLYGGFQPIWSTYPDPIEPKIGQVNPSWVGYGEEAMIVGKQIVDNCKESKLELEPGSSCKDLRLYIYAGDWLGGDEFINIVRFPFPKTPILKSINSKENLANYTYTRNDYYLIMRSTAIKGYGFPYGLKPVFVASGRGFINGWAFRGDQLLESGFMFYNP